MSDNLQEEFESLYQTAKYANSMGDDYIADSTVKSFVVIAMYEALLAEREAREKSEAELLFSKEHGILYWKTCFIRERDRAESAEARIKTSQEQEPVVFCNGDELDYLLGDESGGAIQLVPNANGWQKTPLYAQPIIPPELAALQRENEELRNLSEARKVPEGWKLVPTCPTDAMCKAAHFGPNCGEHNMTASDRAFWEDCYRVMLNASPEYKERT